MGDRFRYLDAHGNKTAELFEHFKQLHNFSNLDLAQTDIDGAKAIQNIIDFEMTVAGFTKPNDKLRDPIAVYNLRSVQNCTMEANLDFLTFLSNQGFSSVKNDTQVIVVNPDFVKKMGKLLNTTPLPLLKDVVSLRTVVSMSNMLPQNIRNQHFHFFSTQLRGITKQKPRWKTCVEFVDSNLGDDLGQRFLKVSGFTENSKRLATSIVDSVIDEFKQSLNYVSWMDTSTQKLAIQKVTVQNKLSFLSLLIIGMLFFAMSFRLFAVYCLSLSHCCLVDQNQSFNWLSKYVDKV